MAQAQADQYYAQQQQDAFLAETAAQAQATAARAQRQRDEDARRAQELIAASRSQVAAAPTPGAVAQQNATPVASAPTPPPTAYTDPRLGQSGQVREEFRKSGEWIR